MIEDAVVLQGVVKIFGSVRAVDHVDLSVPSGCIYGFLGPNGAGKTTIIRMIMDIFQPDEGKVIVLGNSDPSAVKDRVGYLPEEKGLYKKMKAGETLVYFGRLKGMQYSDAKRLSKELLDKYGLGEWYDKRCEALSKGMSQKLQILTTLIHGPELVILDEPFSGLDPVNVELVREVILDIKRKGKTVIFSTHVMEKAEQICDYIFLINRGKKVLDGPLNKVRANAEHGVVIEYDGDGSILRSLPGISRINDSGKHAELFLSNGVDPQDILKGIVGRLNIRRFDLREPSLHEIFVRAVGGKSDE